MSTLVSTSSIRVPRAGASSSRASAIGPRRGALQYHFPLAIDRKAHGGTRLELQRVADMLGDRHLPLARDGGRHAISPKYYRQEQCNTWRVVLARDESNV